MRDKSPVVLTVAGDWLPVGDESPKLGSPVGDGDGGRDWLTPWAGGGRGLHTPAGLKQTFLSVTPLICIAGQTLLGSTPPNSVRPG